MTMTNQKIQYTEEMVGQNHATKSDTLNRLCVGVNNFRLIKSGSNLTLEAVNGNLVDINGNVYAVTSLPTLSPSGLSASTTYYIYLYSNSGTATLEASATGYTVDSVGRANKTGDATRRLMGIAWTTSGTAWSDTDTIRGVISRDNRVPMRLLQTFAASRSTASTGSLAELSETERIGFVCWSDSRLNFQFISEVSNSGAGNVTYSALGIDSTTAASATIGYQPTTASYPVPVTVVVCLSGEVADGYHDIRTLGKVTAGTGTWAAYSALTGEVS